MTKHLLRLALLVPLLVIAAGLAACNRGVTVTDAGEVTSWQFDFADFSRLDISNAFVVDVRPADDYSINVSVDRAVFEYLVVEKRGDTLHIGLENGNTYLNTTQQAAITLPALRELTLSGASRATVARFAGAASLDLNLSGASRAEISTDSLDSASFELSGASRVSGSLSAASFKLKLSGASSANLDGSAPQLEINGSSASTADLKDLPATAVKVALSGASTAFIAVTDRIDATLKEGSVVTYLGNPKMGNLDISGASTIRRAD
jgi:hypothetical protein